MGKVSKLNMEISKLSGILTLEKMYIKEYQGQIVKLKACVFRFKLLCYVLSVTIILMYVYG